MEAHVHHINKSWPMTNKELNTNCCGGGGGMDDKLIKLLARYTLYRWQEKQTEPLVKLFYNREWKIC